MTDINWAERWGLPSRYYSLVKENQKPNTPSPVISKPISSKFGFSVGDRTNCGTVIDLENKASFLRTDRGIFFERELSRITDIELKVEKLEKQNEKMRKALEWYSCIGDRTTREKAQKVLKEIKSES